MIKTILFFTALFYSLSAFGNEIAPRWVTNKPKNNSDYRYYIGNGSNGNCDNARLDVINQIIDELGTQITANYDSFLSESNASMQQNISQRSSAKLKKIVREDVFISNGEDHRCFALYSYPQKEFENEERKIEQTQNKKDTSTELNEINGGKFDLKNSVIFKTNNNLHTIGYINGKRYSFPAKYVDEFKPGKYTIKIIDDYYDAKNVDFIAHKNAETNVNIILKKAEAFLTIKTQLENVNLKINNKNYAPNKEHSFIAGEKLIITADHPSYNFIPQTIILKKNDQKKLNLIPEAKKAKLILNLGKKVSSISIDDEEQNTKKRDFDIIPAEHTISIKIDGIKKTAKIKPAPAEVIELTLDDFLAPSDNFEGNLITLPIVSFIPKSSNYYKNNINQEFIENDHDFSFLKPKLFYKQEGGIIKFITKISFDTKKYNQNYQKPLLSSLRKKSYSNNVPNTQSVRLNCKKNKELSNILCSINPSPKNTTAYLRAGDFQEKIFGDQGEFYVIENFPNFLPMKNYVQQQKLEIFVTFFDNKDNELFSFTHPFILNHFEKRDLIYSFNPTLNQDHHPCKFSNEEHQNCGGTSISFTDDLNFFDFSKDYRIYVGIGVAP